MHPGRTAAIVLDGQTIGFLGPGSHHKLLKTTVFQKLMWRKLTLVTVEAALQAAQPFVRITKFPAVSRDIALLLKAEITRKEFLMLSTLQN